MRRDDTAERCHYQSPKNSDHQCGHRPACKSRGECVQRKRRNSERVKRDLEHLDAVNRYGAFEYGRLVRFAQYLCLREMLSETGWVTLFFFDDGVPTRVDIGDKHHLSETFASLCFSGGVFADIHFKVGDEWEQMGIDDFTPMALLRKIIREHNVSDAPWWAPAADTHRKEAA